MKCNIKQNISEVIKSNIREIVKSSTYDVKMSEIIINLFNYMEEKQLFGGCHALSSTLYVALSEMGLNPILYIGECKKEGSKPFDHSWITIDDKIIDLAIYMPLTQIRNSISGPIVLNIDSVNKNEVNVLYGINTELPLSVQTEITLYMPFVEYMSNFPFEKDGLWDVVKKINPKVCASTDELSEKYKDTERIFVR